MSFNRRNNAILIEERNNKNKNKNRTQGENLVRKIFLISTDKWEGDMV